MAVAVSGGPVDINRGGDADVLGEGPVPGAAVHPGRPGPAGLGRSRGGLTSKVHLAADVRCRPMAFVLTPGQAADSPRFIPVLEKIKGRGPVGRLRTRPDAVAAD